MTRCADCWPDVSPTSRRTSQTGSKQPSRPLTQSRQRLPKPLSDVRRCASLCLAGCLRDTRLQLEEVKARLQRETQHATRDPLTGLTNREGLRRWLGGSELNGVEMPLVGVIMIDLDGFKAVNDTHGHETGDRLLQAVAGALTSCTRAGDLVTRWGGDEFLVLCPGAEGDQLDRLATRMVAAVAEVSIDGVSVCASAGTQSCRYRPLPMAAADEAMYTAKQAGGGRVVAVDSAPAGTGRPQRLARYSSRSCSSSGSSGSSSSPMPAAGGSRR